MPAPGAKLEKVSSAFEFTEGPAVDRRGNVYFTDQPNNRILKWKPGGEISTSLQPSGRANGMYFDLRVNLLVGLYFLGAEIVCLRKPALLI